MHEALIASLVANGMSNAAGITEQWTLTSSKENAWEKYESTKGGDVHQPLAPGVILTFQGYLPGYAWTADEASVKISLAVLITYCLYTTAYLLYAFTTGRGSMAWSTISGITALAMNSRPTHILKSTSAGIDKMETFRNLISVRDIEETGRLELVFRQDEESRGLCRRVTPGKAY